MRFIVEFDKEEEFDKIMDAFSERVASEVKDAIKQALCERKSYYKHVWGEIVFFETYTNAVAVFSEMRIHLYRKNRVSVKDFYEFSGLPANDEDEEYGWTDLEGVRVLEHQPEGYYIDLPKPKLLEPITTAK